MCIRDRRKIGESEVSAVGLVCMGMSHACGEPADKKDMAELPAGAVDIGCLWKKRLKLVNFAITKACPGAF